MIRGIDVKLSAEEEAGVLERLQKVVSSSFFMWGDQQEEFQDRIAAICGRRHGMTWSSSTTAAEAIFDFLRPDNVAFQGNQFPSLVFAARRAGAGIVWVDIDLQMLSPTPVQLEKAWQREHFDVFVLQHTGGIVSGYMPAVCDWCHARGVFLLEDASQALGSTMTGEKGILPAGHFGDAALISFSGTKIITSGGQGSVVVFDDDGLVAELFARKVYGRNGMFQKGEWEQEGWNGQMTELQAAVGNALLETLEKRIDERAKIASVYESLFKGLGIVKLGSQQGRPCGYKYPVMVPPGRGLGSENPRFALSAWLLEKKDIQLSAPVYDVQSNLLWPFKGEYDREELGNTSVFTASHACLPLHNNMTVDDARAVVAAIVEYYVKTV